MINSFKGQYTFLSNFHPAQVEFEGETYPTVEHAYMAAKTLNLSDRISIRCSVTPSAAKRLGRLLTLRNGWNEMKLAIMEDLVRKKFAHPDLKKKLRSTGTEPLAEGNWWGDTFWGVCRGVGENHLGKILMKIREED